MATSVAALREREKKEGVSPDLYPTLEILSKIGLPQMNNINTPFKQILD